MDNFERDSTLELALELSRTSFKEALKRDETVRNGFNEFTKSKGSRLMVLQLTEMKYAIDDESLKAIAKMTSSMPSNTYNMIIDDLVKRIDYHSKSTINLSLLTAFVLARMNLVKDKNVQEHIVDKFNEVFDTFVESENEIAYSNFVYSYAVVEHWIEDLVLREQVGIEIDKIEKEPI